MGPVTHTDADGRDRLARWGDLPARIEPASWSESQDTEPVPGSITEADVERHVRDALQR
jgi:hypothetical protein